MTGFLLFYRGHELSDRKGNPDARIDMARPGRRRSKTASEDLSPDLIVHSDQLEAFAMKKLLSGILTMMLVATVAEAGSQDAKVKSSPGGAGTVKAEKVNQANEKALARNQRRAIKRDVKADKRDLKQDQAEMKRLRADR